MKKVLLPIFAISFALFSCSSDEGGGSTQGSSNGLKLVRIVETDLDDNSVLTSTLSYTDNFISKVEGTESTGNTYKTEFVYENRRLARENHYENSASTGYITLSYTGDRVTSTASREDGITFTTNYTYNSGGFVINEKQYRDGTLDDDRDYGHDSSGNIVSYAYDAGSANYTYDTGKNPFSLVYSDAVMKVSGTGFSKNNITKETVSNGTVRNYTYTYNSEGYPTEVIKTDDFSTTKTNYYYE